MFGAALSLIVCLAPGAQETKDQRLIPGARTDETISGSGRRTFAIDLTVGQVVDGGLRERGVHVALVVKDPRGLVRGEFYAASTYVPFSVVATEPGTYRLEVTGADDPGVSGQFGLKLDVIGVDAYAARLDKEEFGENSVFYAYAQDVRRRGESAVDQIMEDRRGKGPVVEPYTQDAKERYVTFLYRGDDHTEQVNTWTFELGTAPLDLSLPGTMPMPLQRLAGSSLWYLRTRLPTDTLLGYNFEVIRSHPIALPGGRILAVRDAPLSVNDPLVTDSIFGRSILRLEDAPVQPWIVPHSDEPHGQLERSSLTSRILGERRTFTVYRPADKFSKRADRLLVVFDGEAYGADRMPLVPTPTVLDNLIARGLIPPTVAVFVNAQETRMRDFANYAPFQDFVADELLPWVQRNYEVSRRPADTVVAGSSLGGLCAASVAFRHPNRFGAVLCQSPSLYPSPGPISSSSSFVKIRDGEALIHQFRDSRRKPIRFYMDSGLFEGPLLDADREFRDVLDLKGYPLAYVEHSGSHDYVYWRNSIGNGLIALLGHPQAGANRHRRFRRRTKRPRR